MELSVTLYEVIESRTHIEHDSPAIGAFRRIPRGSKKYGPFSSRDEAMEKVDERKEHYLSRGYSRKKRNEMAVMDTSTDIDFEIGERHIPLRGALARAVLGEGGWKALQGLEALIGEYEEP